MTFKNPGDRITYEVNTLEKELRKFFIKSIDVPKESEKLFDQIQDFRLLMMKYGCAIREVKTKFEVLNDEFSAKNNRNPIEMIKARVKSPESLLGKLKRLDLEPSAENISDYINDIAGVRIICSFVDDIYKIADMFTSQDDVTVLKVKDYIKNPKENGYRSYHLIVEIPVFFSNKKQNVKVEIQLRTIAMDFWASLEHEIKYKKEIESSDDLIKRLKKCADIISSTDYEMQNIGKEIELAKKKNKKKKS